MNPAQEAFHWRLIDQMMRGEVKKTHLATPCFDLWLHDKATALIDCIEQVDVSVFPELPERELYYLVFKAIYKGEAFYKDACENPALLNGLMPST